MTTIALTIGLALGGLPNANAGTGLGLGDPSVHCYSSTRVALGFSVSTDHDATLALTVYRDDEYAWDSIVEIAVAHTSTAVDIGQATDGAYTYEVEDLQTGTLEKAGSFQVHCGVSIAPFVTNPRVDCESHLVTLTATARNAGLVSTEYAVNAPDGGLVAHAVGTNVGAVSTSMPVRLDARIVNGEVVPSPFVEGRYSFSVTLDTGYERAAVENGSFTVSCSPGAATLVSPTRALDTRMEGGMVVGDESRSLQVTGVGGVPFTGVSAVLLNVTMTESTTGGYLTVYPTGSMRPTASNLNWSSGAATIANAVAVKVGAQGKIDLYQSGPGRSHVIVDIMGYYLDGAVTDPGGFTSLAPARILDTRSGDGAIPAGGSRDLQVSGSGGVPASGVSAVVLNVTVAATTSGGYLTAYPTGSTLPTASNLNWSSAATTIPNLATVMLGTDGKISLYQSGPGSAQVIVDVAGYYLGGTAITSGMFVALAPSRVLDTRATGAVAGGGYTRLPILSKGGIPATGVAAVVVNATVTETRAEGFLTVYPGTDSLPTASNLNWRAGATIPNLVTVKTGTDGSITFYNGSRGSTQIIADAAGFFLD